MDSLEALDEGVVLAIAGAKGGNSGKVKLKSHHGLVGEGILEGMEAPQLDLVIKLFWLKPEKFLFSRFWQ